MTFPRHLRAVLAAALVIAAAGTSQAHTGNPQTQEIQAIQPSRPKDIIFKPGLDKDEVVVKVIFTNHRAVQLAFNGAYMKARFYEDGACSDMVVFTNRRAYEYQVCANGHYSKTPR